MKMSKYLSSLLLLLLVGGCSLPRIIVLNDPLDAGQHNDLGVAYEQRQDFDLALREYERAAELDDNWALPLFNLGNVHSRLEQWPLAVDAYRAALERAPDEAPAMNNLAWALLKAGDLAEGVASAERAVVLDGTEPAYWDTLASAYLQAGCPEAADRAARQGLSLDPPAPLRKSLQDKTLANTQSSQLSQ